MPEPSSAINRLTTPADATKAGSSEGNRFPSASHSSVRIGARSMSWKRTITLSFPSPPGGRRRPSAFCLLLEALEQLGLVEFRRLLLEPAQRGPAAAECAQPALAVLGDEVGERAEAAGAGAGGGEIESGAGGGETEAGAVLVERVGEPVDALHRPHRRHQQHRCAAGTERAERRAQIVP